MRYFTNANTPGFLPNSDPAEFDTLDEAREDIAAELNAAFQNPIGDPSQGDLNAALAAANVLEAGEHVAFDGMIYFISRA